MEQDGVTKRIPIGRLAPGIKEALLSMEKGERRTFWIPGDLAYDALPNPPRFAPKGMETMDITLQDFF